MAPIDSFFESMSGITTTGATVITGLDELPRSLLLYRQLLQWLGGMGLIVLAIAIMPLLGIGGGQIFKTDVPGAMNDQKLIMTNYCCYSSTFGHRDISNRVAKQF